MSLTFTMLGKQTTIEQARINELRAECMEEGKEYLDLIKEPTIKALALAFWEHAPDYFFVIPATSTGKYHAEWATTECGLFRHVVMGMYTAYEFARTYGLDDIQRDCAVAAMAGHDCLKYGIDYDVRYFDMHPFLPRSYYGNPKLGHYVKNLVTTDKWNVIMDAIERHMGSIATGEWTSVGGGTGRFKPENAVEYVVHTADYVASRGKLVHIDFLG